MQAQYYNVTDILDDGARVQALALVKIKNNP